jgi:hypothetical protein
MTLEQLERRREYSRERAARYRAKVKDTPEFKAKVKLYKENRTEEQREQARKSRREYAARRRAKDPEKANAYKSALKRKKNKETPEKYRKANLAWVRANPVKAAAAKAKWLKSDKGWLSSCKDNLAKRLGVFRKDVPVELVEAKFAQLKVIRLVRDLG